MLQIKNFFENYLHFYWTPVVFSARGEFLPEISRLDQR